MNILVIAAHPDDEILGCGGTIAKHIKNGDNVNVVIMAQGIVSRGGSSEAQAKAIEELASTAKKANACLGVNNVTLLKLPDNQMDTLSRLEITQQVEKLIEQFKPERVYTHHIGDVNIDHRRIHEAVVTACRPQPNHPVKTLLFFEVASSTEWQPPQSAPAFSPNWFNDISDTLCLKTEALNIYACEMREWPHARSVQALEHLARWRGATIATEAAEAFILGRHLS